MIAAEQKVVIRRSWNDDKTAVVLRSDLHDLRMDDTSGGIQKRSPRLMVYGYISCDKIIEGEIAHSGLHGSCPHRIKVVVIGKFNPKKLMDELKAEARARDLGASP